MKKIMAAIALTGALALVATPAFADQAPNPQERAAVARVLRANGFVGWEQIELNDGGPRWEIDDAVSRDGKRYDVELDPRTLRIVSQFG